MNIRLRTSSASIAFCLATAVLAVPSAANAQQVRAQVTTDLNQRAGPSTRFPVIATAPEGSAITLFGCISDLSWCDGAYLGYRGWFSARYLHIPYRSTNLTVASYMRYAYLPTVSFVIGSYWERYYRERPFYAKLSVYEGGSSVNVSVGSFYRPLARHGQWTEIKGRYVFIPRVDADWQPYTNGRWVYTNRHGWMWVSDEPFGWATYHYGRWAYSSRVGWLWVPGTRWAPAWVAWRKNDEHLAWAPLPPDPSDSFGISVQISFGSIPNYYWRAVRAQDFQSDNIRTVVISDRNIINTIVNETQEAGTVSVVNNVVVNNQIEVNFVEEQTGVPVVAREVALTSSEQRNGELTEKTVEIFHPAAAEVEPVEAPEEVASIEEAAQQAATAGQSGDQPATEDLVPPAPAAGETPPATATMEAPPLLAEGEEPTPAEEAGQPAEAGALPEGIEACAEGTLRQADGNCGVPVTEAPPAEQLTPETPAADAPPPTAEGQPPLEATPSSAAPAPAEGTPPVEAMPPAAPSEQPEPAPQAQPQPQPADPSSPEPCEEGAVRQQDGSCATPEASSPAREESAAPQTPAQPAPAPAPEQPVPEPQPQGSAAPPAAEPQAQEAEACPDGQVRNSEGACVPQ